MKTIGYFLVCCVLVAGNVLSVPASASGEQMSAVDKSSDVDSAVAMASMESSLLHRLTREARRKKKGKGRNSKGKNKNKNKNEGRWTIENRQDACPVCVEKLRDLALVFGNQARNVYRQARRSLADIDMIAKKKAKSGDFTLHLSQLLKHLNQTLPMKNPPVPPVDCNFTGTNFTTASLVDDSNLLASCKSNIDIECAPLPVDRERLSACETAANDYRACFTSLFKGKSYTQICGAVSNPLLLTLEQKVKDCVEFTSTCVETLDSQLKECKKEFSNCRMAERNIIEYMFLCKGPGTSCEDDGPISVPITSTIRPTTTTTTTTTTTLTITTTTATATNSDTTTTTCSTTTACSCSCSCCS